MRVFRLALLLALLTAQVALIHGGLAPVAHAAPPAPDVYAGIKMELLNEGIDPQGRWYQTFRATIRSGGTISDVAMAVYNDIGRSDDVFQAAQRENPDLKNPAFVYVGQTMDITIDPTVVSVYKETKQQQNGAVSEHHYYNGVVETYFRDPKSGILRTIDFPADQRAPSFTFADEFEGVTENLFALPGTRLVDYRYVQGDAFGDVTLKVFGVNSVRAANELIKQSGWDPNNWPPSGEGRTRLVVDTQASYVDERPRTLDYTPASPAARDLWSRLSAQREAAGIYPARMEKDGIVYQVIVGSGAVTAKQVTKLLFNDESRYLAIVQAAGIQPPATDPTKVPQNYDPLLVGRTFEIKAPFADERFAVDERVPDAKGALVTHLANGTVIYEYDRGEDGSGLLRLIEYPNGYKNMLSRPGGLGLLALDFIHFQMVNLANPELPREQRELLAREFQARMLWTWTRGVPREFNDVAEDLRLHVEESDTTLEVLARQRQDVPWQEALVYRLWFQYPLLIGAGVVGFATLVLLAVSWRARRAQARRWRERMGRRG